MKLWTKSIKLNFACYAFTSGFKFRTNPGLSKSSFEQTSPDCNSGDKTTATLFKLPTSKRYKLLLKLTYRLRFLDKRWHRLITSPFVERFSLSKTEKLRFGVPVITNKKTQTAPEALELNKTQSFKHFTDSGQLATNSLLCWQLNFTLGASI